MGAHWRYASSAGLGPLRPLERNWRRDALSHKKSNQHALSGLRKNIRAEHVVYFIQELRKRLRRPLIICLDRWSVHRSAARRIKALAVPGVQFEWLPAYAPELNPVEARWCHVKYADLANFVPDDVRQLKRTVQSSLIKQRDAHRLKQSFFKTAKLRL